MILLVHSFLVLVECFGKFTYILTMFYKKIYLKNLVFGFNPEQKKTDTVYLVRFLNEVLIKQSIRFFTRKGKSNLVDTFISIVKKLFVSKAVIFSNFGR